MNRAAVLGVTALGLVLTLSVLAPGVAPVVVTSPESGSMAPTAEPHSLVVLTDTDPAVGDVALFETASRDQPVLHRLVGTTPDGDAFLTQGDANEVTDQETGDEPVQRSDVYGTVPTVAGQPLIVPYAGVVLTNPAVGLGVWALLGLSLLYTTTGGRSVRMTVAAVPVRIHLVLVALTLMVALPLATVAAPATVEAEVVTTTTAPADAPAVVQPGETGEQSVTVSSPTLWGVHTVAQADGDLAVTGVERRSGTHVVTVQNEPSDTPGVERATVSVYSYPAILPRSSVTSLAAIHPAVPAFATSLLLGGPLLLGAVLSTDPRVPIRASRNAIARRRRSGQQDESHPD